MAISSLKYISTVTALRFQGLEEYLVTQNSGRKAKKKGVFKHFTHTPLPNYRPTFAVSRTLESIPRLNNIRFGGVPDYKKRNASSEYRDLLLSNTWQGNVLHIFIHVYIS